MPPKIDLKAPSGKRENAIYVLNELFVEFETLYSVKPGLNLLAAVFNEIESKCRAVKKQMVRNPRWLSHFYFYLLLHLRFSVVIYILFCVFCFDFNFYLHFNFPFSFH